MWDCNRVRTSKTPSPDSQSGVSKILMPLASLTMTTQENKSNLCRADFTVFSGCVLSLLFFPSISPHSFPPFSYSVLPLSLFEELCLHLRPSGMSKPRAQTRAHKVSFQGAAPVSQSPSDGAWGDVASTKEQCSLHLCCSAIFSNPVALRELDFSVTWVLPSEFCFCSALLDLNTTFFKNL